MTGHQDPAEHIRTLQSTLDILEAENEQLAERAEHISLLGSVSEAMALIDDRDELIGEVLERISILKDLPLCLYCVMKGPHAVPAAEYAAFSGQVSAVVSVRLTARLMDQLREGSVVTTVGPPDTHEIELELRDVDFCPRSAAVLPCVSRSVDQGLFVLVSDDATTDRLQAMHALLDRIIDMTADRLDKINLIEELTEINAKLDHLVEMRTAQLEFSNRRLQQEIDTRVKAEDAFKAVVRSTAGVTGQACFEEAVTTLCEWLDADAALVAELGKDGLLHCPAMQIDGQLVRGCQLKLSGTLHELVLHDGFTAIGEATAAGLEPNHAGMPFTPAAYIGMVLLDPQQSPVGLISCFSRRPIEFPANAREVFGVIAVRSTTELLRQRSEERRIELEHQLGQAHKMEAIGQLAGGIAHDFNNLLHVILGYSNLAKTALGDRDSAHDDLRQIERAASRASELVQRLLSFSRRESSHPVQFSVNDMINETVRMLERVIGEDVALKLHLDDCLPPLVADRSQIEQVLMNLVINARDAVGGDGLITIEAERVVIAAGDLPALTWALPGEYLMLVVSDNGCGMEAAVRDRIFEPFFTTKEQGSGTGLGLAAVYGIVQQHCGGINVYSEPGVGTTIRVYLPLVETSAAIATGPTAVSADELGGDETILIAEDDELVRNLAVRILTEAGYTLIVASDGAEGARLLHEHGSNLDLAVLDVIMPKMNGAELRQLITKKYPELPVIFASGYGFNTLQSRQIEVAAHEIIQKPYSTISLLSAIRQALDRRKTEPS